MILCRTIQVRSFGLALVHENTAGITTSIQYARNLGEDKVRALPFFRAFSGSDATSQFSGKGKKTT